jgi:hypothetical protein
VPWYDWHNIQHDPEQQQQYLLRLFKEAGVHVPAL